MGLAEKTIIEQCRRFNEQLPARIAGAPLLEPGLEWFYAAFFRLTGERNGVYNSESQIPWSAIQKYCYARGIFDPEEIDYAWEIFNSMDQVYLKYRAKKVKESAAPAGRPLQ